MNLATLLTDNYIETFADAIIKGGRGSGWFASTEKRAASYKSLGLSAYIRIKEDLESKKTEFVFRNNTRKYEKEFQKVMIQYFKDQEKEALSLVNKSYSPLDSVEETLIPSIGLLRVFPKKKKVIQKGGAGSGNFGHAGIPGQVGGSTSGTGGGSLFHGTSSELVNKIKTEGLKDLYLSHSDTPNVFSATDIFIALEYGVGQAKKKGLDEVAVVVINSEGVNSREVSGTGIHISENIPPSAIRRIDIYSVSDIDKYIKRVYESDTGSQGVPVPKPKQSVSIEKSVSKDMLVVLLFTGSSKKKSYFDIETKATNNPFSGWSYKDSKWNKRLQKEGSKFISSIYEKEGSRVWKELSYQITDGLEGAFSVENPLVAEYISDYSYKFAQGVNEYTVGMLQGAMTTGMSEGLGMDGIAKLIMDVFDTCTKYRSLLIARTETIRASNGGAEAAYMQSGVVEGKEWLVTEDDLTCPLCNRMAGKVKRLNENYFNLGDKLLAEGTTMVFDYEDVSFPPLHPSCRCTILPVIKETYKPKTAELFEIKYPGLSMFIKVGTARSGNRGHSGRPGKVGGSGGGEGESTFKDKELREIDIAINKSEILKQINIPPYLYHVTSSEKLAKKIEEEGIKVGQDRFTEIGESGSRAYLTNDQYGILDSPEWEDAEPVVLKVKSEGISLRLDPEYYRDFKDDVKGLVEFANKKPGYDGGLYVYTTKSISPSSISREKQVEVLVTGLSTILKRAEILASRN